MVHAAVPVAGRGGSVEAAPPEDAVCERLGPDADDLVQAAFREPGRERFRALGEGVEERGGKHVPGHPADGIQMNVHPRILLRFLAGDGWDRHALPDPGNRSRTHALLKVKIRIFPPSPKLGTISRLPAHHRNTPLTASASRPHRRCRFITFSGLLPLVPSCVSPTGIESYPSSIAPT